MGVILIGTGGIGTGVIRRVYQKAIKIPDLKVKISPPEGQSPRIRFISLDIDPEYDSKIEAELLVPPNFFVEKLDEVVRTALQNDEIFRTWWIKKYHPRGTLKGITGAGQIRVNGRLCFYYNYRNVYELLRNVLARLMEIGYGENNPIKIFVVSSLGGGTGSGMISDVGFLVRKICNELGLNWYRLIGFFIDGTVTSRLPQLKQTAVYAYAAFTELSFWMENPQRYEFRGRGISEIYRGENPPFDFIFLIQEQTQRGERFVGTKGDLFADYKNFLAECLLLMLQGERAGAGNEGVMDRFIIANSWRNFDNLYGRLRWGGIGIGSITVPLNDIKDFVISEYLKENWENGSPFRIELPPVDSKKGTWNIDEVNNQGILNRLFNEFVSTYRRFDSGTLERIARELPGARDKRECLERWRLAGDFSEWKKEAEDFNKKSREFLYGENGHYKQIVKEIREIVEKYLILLKFNEIQHWIDELIKVIEKNGELIKKIKGPQSSGELEKKIKEYRKTIFNPPKFDLFGRKLKLAISGFTNTLREWRDALIRENLNPLAEEFYNTLKDDLKNIRESINAMKTEYDDVLRYYTSKGTLPTLHLLQILRRENREYPLEIQLGYTRENIINNVYKKIYEEIKNVEGRFRGNLEGDTELSDCIKQVIALYLSSKNGGSRKINEANAIIRKKFNERINHFFLNEVKGVIEGELNNFRFDYWLDLYFDGIINEIRKYRDRPEEEKAKLRVALENIFRNQASYLWNEALRPEVSIDDWRGRALEGLLEFLSSTVSPFIVVKEERVDDIARYSSTTTEPQRLDINSVWYPSISRYGGIIQNYATRNGWGCETTSEFSTSIVFYNQIAGLELKHLALLERTKEEYFKNIKKYTGATTVSDPMHADERFYKEFVTDIMPEVREEDVILLALGIGFNIIEREKRRWYYKDPTTGKKTVLGESLPRAMSELRLSSEVSNKIRRHLGEEIETIYYTHRDRVDDFRNSLYTRFQKSFEEWKKAEPSYGEAYDLWKRGYEKLNEYLENLREMSPLDIKSKIQWDIGYQQR